MFQDQLPSAEEVSRTLADILSGPDFEAFAGGLLIRMLSQLWMRFRDWVRGFFPDVSDAQAEFLTVLIPVVCLGAVAFVVLRSLPQANPQSTRRDPDAVPDELRTASDWLRIAAERAGDSEYRHAATALYQGLILTLERRGAVDVHPSKTPGEYGLEAAGGGVINEREKADATAFIHLFQELAFGHETPTPSGYRGLEALAERVGCTVTGRAGQ